MALGCAQPKSETLETQKPVPQDNTVIPKYDPIPEQKFGWVTEDGGQSQLDFNPRIDILFVTDNSDSMVSAEQNLKRNIDKFTSGVMQNKMIDYHIGTVSTWDSTERAVTTKKDGYDIGDLRYVKDSKGQKYNARFLTRKTGTVDLIASTLDIGILPYNQGGPEIEEFFSPIQAAIEKTGHAAVNEGFFRDDAHLVIVVMTDADDSTKNVSPEQMAQNLIDFKKGQTNKLSVYGVLVQAQDPDNKKDWDLRIHPKYHPECFTKTAKGFKNNGTCKGFGPDRMDQFIVASNPSAGTPDQIRNKFIMKITNPDYGSDLARIGSDITAKTLEKTIFLQQRPRVDDTTQKLMLRVRYGSPDVLAKGGGQLIPQGNDSQGSQNSHGWLYNAQDNSIFLSGKIQYQYVEGAKFAVDLQPLTLKAN
jgi:hypothetical protein